MLSAKPLADMGETLKPGWDINNHVTVLGPSMPGSIHGFWGPVIETKGTLGMYGIWKDLS